MSEPSIRSTVLHDGKSPPCLRSRQQCRGCYGWRNMLKAARTDDLWQRYPFRCAVTGLTLKIDGKIS